jgi:hypothetical protein
MTAREVKLDAARQREDHSPIATDPTGAERVSNRRNGREQGADESKITTGSRSARDDLIGFLKELIG